MFELKFLEWDSSFYSRSICSCKIPAYKAVDEVEKSLLSASWDVCYVFSEQRLNGSLLNDQTLVDEKVLFVKKIFERTVIDHDSCIKPWFQYTQELFDLAILSGTHSRFKTDPNLSDRFDQMYGLWLEKSLNRELAKELFVYESDNKVLGFVTVKVLGKSAIVGLIAVNELVQRRRIGSSLLAYLENWCLDNGMDELKIETQAFNTQACKFYIKNNYSVEKTDYIYHLHRESIG